MTTTASRLTALTLAATGLALASAGSASAATTASWTCRASAVEAQLLNQSRLTPLLADRTPCATTATGLPNVGQATGLAPGVTAKTADASTNSDPPGAFPIKQTVSAEAGIEGAQVTLIPGLDLRVSAARSTATGSCAGGTPKLDGTSTAVGLTLNGQPIVLDGLLSGILDPISASPLGAVLSVKLNEQVKDATGLTQRAAHVMLLSGVGPDATPLADVVVAEARVSADQACDANAPGNSGALTPTQQGELCPAGSMLDVTRSVCVIPADGSMGAGGSGSGDGTAGSSTGGPIQTSGSAKEVVIGAPNQSPSGGSVLSLVNARKKYRSACLQGAGPDYAVIGTAKGDKITGTNGPDRILALAGNDQVAGGRGNDCMDGATGVDSLSGSLGDDREYGMAGGDHLNGGPGTDTLVGGTGNDTINTAFGADRVVGGSGVDFINAATAGKAARISCGGGRDKVRVNRNEVKGLKGCEVKRVLR